MPFIAAASAVISISLHGTLCDICFKYSGTATVFSKPGTFTWTLPSYLDIGGCPCVIGKRLEAARIQPGTI